MKEAPWHSCKWSAGPQPAANIREFVEKPSVAVSYVFSDTFWTAGPKDPSVSLATKDTTTPESVVPSDAKLLR